MRAWTTALRQARFGSVDADRVLAALLLGTGEADVWLGQGGAGRPVAAASVVVFALGLAVRRRFPAAAGTCAGILQPLLIAFLGDQHVVSNVVAYLCALYALAVWTPTSRFLTGLLALGAADLAATATSGNSALWALATIVIVLIVRRVVRDRDRRAELAERERDVAAREAVAAERARIARELHDVVAHSVSVMVVQAQAGPRLLEEPERARGSFGAIEASGREALVELRRLLGILRTGDDRLATGPQPGLGSLDSLVAQVRDAGLRVQLRVEGEPVGLPPGIDLSAYRIIQEALTNTLKHAGEAEAQLVVRYGPSSLELEVIDNGSAARAERNGSGHGLIGMRERVALYGGVLEAGARNGHGFAVRARLPLGGGAG